MSVQQGPLALLKRLSEAGLQLLDSQPTLASTVEAWVRQKFQSKDDGGTSGSAGIATLISEPQVVHLLAAALTRLLKDMTAASTSITRR
jgi:hypothetical protein